MEIQISEALPDTGEDSMLGINAAIADQAFRELAIRDTSSIEATVAQLLAAKLAQVKDAKPDLTEIEAYIVAGRLVKQMIGCYMAAINQLLP